MSMTKSWLACVYCVYYVYYVTLFRFIELCISVCHLVLSVSTFVK